jgi:hypothetical protein
MLSSTVLPSAYKIHIFKVLKSSYDLPYQRHYIELLCWEDRCSHIMENLLVLGIM